MRTTIILADDFTGAGDSGVHFARGGLTTALLLDIAGLDAEHARYEALSLSTESRFLKPGEAAATVAALAARCVALGAEIRFKKVDSTLRGNLGAEIEAVLAATGQRAALVCTAMPKTGRTCTGGMLFIRGVPLHETEIGRDPFNPVPSSEVATVLAAQTALPLSILSLGEVRSGEKNLAERAARLIGQGSRILVADAETDGDLAALGLLVRDADAGRHGLSPLLPVGAGGLAEACALARNPGAPSRKEPPSPKGRMLAVVGSLTGTSRTQADRALAKGAFHPLTIRVADGLADPEREYARLAREAAAANGKHLLLRTENTPKAAQISGETGTHVARLFGGAARAICAAAPRAIIYATGGSTAVAVASAFGIHAIRLEDECMPGVVLAACPDSEDHCGIRWFISKAGGFGPPETLEMLAERFSP